jgi:hypothetical protein
MSACRLSFKGPVLLFFYLPPVACGDHHCVDMWPAARGQGDKGHSKKKVTDPYVYLISSRGTNQPPNIIFLHFFFEYVFGRFSVRGVQKHDFKKMQKVHVKNFFRENSQKIDKNFDVTFSSTFFVLSCF